MYPGPVGKVGLRIVLFPPLSVVGETIQKRNAVVQFDEIEAAPPGFLHRRWMQMQLADGGCDIAGFFEPGLEEDFAARQRRVVHTVAVGVRVAPREETGAGRNANWSLNEGMSEIRRTGSNQDDKSHGGVFLPESMIDDQPSAASEVIARDASTTKRIARVESSPCWS